MNPALRKLLIMRLRGGCRQRLRDARSVKGVVLLCVIGVFVFFVLSSINSGENTALRQSISSMDSLSANWLPLGLLLTCLLTVITSSGPALYFSQAEINVLFTAPISRASLVIYKIVSYASSAFFSALVLTPFLPKIADSRVATLLAMLITLLFVQLFSTAIRMGVQILRNKYHLASFKTTVLLLISSIVLVGAYSILSQSNMFDLLLNFVDSGTCQPHMDSLFSS